MSDNSTNCVSFTMLRRSVVANVIALLASSVARSLKISNIEPG